MRLVGILLLGLICGSCDKGSQGGSSAPAAVPSVASLVPSATDLIYGIGAQNHLVAVSNYDTKRQLPHVGDYITIDWEKLAPLRPSVLITFYAEGRTPAGILDRARVLGIHVVNMRFDRLSDVYKAITTLGQVCAEPQKALAERNRLEAAIKELQETTAKLPSIRTLIAIDPLAHSFAGRGTYLSDLLETAGGENAIESDDYPSLDSEAVRHSNAQAVIVLLPDADQATQDKAMQYWNTLVDLPAVQAHHVWCLTESDVMMPGSHVGELAIRFARLLHPQENGSSQPFHPSTKP